MAKLRMRVRTHSSLEPGDDVGRSTRCLLPQVPEESAVAQPAAKSRSQGRRGGRFQAEKANNSRPPHPVSRSACLDTAVTIRKVSRIVYPLLYVRLSCALYVLTHLVQAHDSRPLSSESALRTASATGWPQHLGGRILRVFVCGLFPFGEDPGVRENMTTECGFRSTTTWRYSG